jgi:hypothetical protein
VLGRARPCNDVGFADGGNDIGAADGGNDSVAEVAAE